METKRTIILLTALMLATPTAFAGGSREAKTKQTPPVPGLMSFDEAISGGAAAVEGKVPGSTEIAVYKIESPLSALSGFLNDELSARFNANGKLTVLPRGKALESVDAERDFQMSGRVDDKSAVRIGHAIGAKVVVSGTFDRFDNFSQLRLRAIDVEKQKLLAMYSARINNNDIILADVTRTLEGIKPVIIQEDALEYLNRGKDLYAESNYDAAIVELSKALAVNANLEDAFSYRGIAYGIKGEYDRAIADFNAALNINPNDAITLCNRGTAYAKNGEYDRAIADFTAALNIDPDDVIILYNRGIAYTKNIDYFLALADFNQAISIDPNNDSAYFNRGSINGNLGDYEQAIADFTAALNINPNDTNTLTYRGRAYAEKGDYNRALADFNQAITINPNYTNAYLDRGVMYAMQDDLNHAISDWETVLRIDPKDVQAKQHLKKARAQRGY